MSVWDEVQRARAAAHAKHGANSIDAVPGGDPRWLPILVEEIGEVAHEATYDATGDLRAELIDVLAVASAWVDALDGVERRPAPADVSLTPGTLAGDLAADVFLEGAADRALDNPKAAAELRALAARLERTL